MRNVILSAVAGLVVGMIGAVAYEVAFGDGARLADLQAQLDEANAALTALKKDKQTNAHATSSVADQLDQLSSDNADLRKQIDALKAGSTNAPAAEVTPAQLADTIRGMMRGGPGMMGQQRMFLLKTRLKLTPEQEAKIKAAMDADGKARRDLMRQWFTNGKIDPAAAAAANTLDATLKSTLTGNQQIEYQKVQADEKTSRADSMASMQVNNMAPLLQLNDSQKDQVMNALYQAQSNAPDPTTLMTDPNAMATLTSQTLATQAALAKVLTADQLALYNQQLQSGGFGGGFPGGGFGGRPRGNGNGGTAQATTTAPATTTAAPAQ